MQKPESTQRAAEAAPQAAPETAPKGLMRYRLFLLAATVIWGSSFVVMKDALDHVSTSWILAFRFLLAAAILAVLFLKWRKLYFERGHVLAGIAIGLALLAAYYFQTVGLTDTTPGKNAFLTAAYCVLVPFLTWLFMRKRPNGFNLVAAVVCLVGIGCISLTGDLSMRMGDALTLVCAIFFGLQIVFIGKYAPGRNIFVLTLWQFITVGVGSLVIGLISEPMPEWGSLPGDAWVQLLYLAVLGTAAALLFQNIGQQHVPPSSAALLLSFESVFGAVFSIAFGMEDVTVRLLVGFVLVFGAVVISEWLPTVWDRKFAKRLH